MEASILDQIQFEFDVIFVIAGTNKKKSEKDKKVVYVKNKIDLKHMFEHPEIGFDLELNSKDSVSSLIDVLKDIMDVTNTSDEIMLISQRQISAV